MFTAEKRVIPGAEPGQYEPGTFMTVTLSCDHRVIDGLFPYRDPFMAGYFFSLY